VYGHADDLLYFKCVVCICTANDKWWLTKMAQYDVDMASDFHPADASAVSLSSLVFGLFNLLRLLSSVLSVEVLLWCPGNGSPQQC